MSVVQHPHIFFVALTRASEYAAVIGDEKIKFSKNAGHLSHFVERGTSDENGGLSRRMLMLPVELKLKF